MFVIRNVVFEQPSDDKVDRVVIVDRPGLDAFLVTKLAVSPNESPPEVLPTGIYLQSMKLVAPNEVFISGYVWQKYGPDQPADSEPGFVLADATNPRITEAYRYEKDGVKTVGWQIEV